MRTRHFTLPEHNIISLSAVCVCELTQADITYRGRAEQKLVPLKLLLLAVNNANKDFVSSLSPSHLSLILKFIPPFIHLLICSFSIFLSLACLCLSTVLHPSFLLSPLPFCSSRQMVSVSLGWLQNQRCYSFFSSIAPFLPLSLPSLILVSSHCGAFNARYHMVAKSSWRCGGTFIGASKHSCNNAHQGSGFFITLMLKRANPSTLLASTRTHSTPLPSLNTKPQIGWESLQEGCNHKPHSASDVMCWRDARHTRQRGYKVTMFLCF